MGFLNNIMSFLFGGDRNVIVETAQVFRENSENAGVRAAATQSDVLQQFAAEFATGGTSWFDGFVNGLNRLPRPMMAIGTLALIMSAMYDPLWFSARMEGLSLVPEPLWWLMGAIVSFYFGARHQVKSQEFQTSITETLARTAVVRQNITALKPASNAVETPATVLAPIILSAFETENAALRDWQASHG